MDRGDGREREKKVGEERNQAQNHFSSSDIEHGQLLISPGVQLWYAYLVRGRR